jgi:hypothetical protein
MAIPFLLARCSGTPWLDEPVTLPPTPTPDLKIIAPGAEADEADDHLAAGPGGGGVQAGLVPAADVPAPEPAAVPVRDERRRPRALRRHPPHCAPPPRTNAVEVCRTSGLGTNGGFFFLCNGI